MSKLYQFGRRFETFDPTSASHREILKEVLEKKSWGVSPIRFWSDSEDVDLFNKCSQQIALYYLKKEFDK